MTVEEAGRNGWTENSSKTHGPEFYSEIWKQGRSEGSTGLFKKEKSMKTSKDKIIVFLYLILF